MNIPNKITLSRIVLILALLVALFVMDLIPGFTSPMLMLTQNSGISLVYLISCIVFAVAALTDAVDGHLARKWHQVTDLGKFLDPVADKLLVDSMLVFLTVQHYGSPSLSIPVFAVIVMVARDLVVDALRFVAANKGIVLAANIFGKIKTVCQMVAIPLVLLNGWPFVYFDEGWGYFRIAEIVVYLATLASLLSGIIYVVKNFSVFQEKKHD